MDDLPNIPGGLTGDRQSNGRGWWDYAPQNHDHPETQTDDPPVEAEKRRGNPFMVFRRDNAKSQPKQAFSVLRKPPNGSEKDDMSAHATVAESRLRNSLAPSTITRFSKFVPRMELFQDVMKDEVCSSPPEFFPKDLMISLSYCIQLSSHQHVS